MAQYDGSIIFGTGIDTSGIKKDSKQLEKELKNLADAQKSFLEAGGAKTSPVYKEYEKEIESVQSALESLKKTQEEQTEPQKDEHWNQLKIDVEEYAKSLKELQDQGKFFGDEDYDKIYLAWKNATDAVKAYQAELNKQTESGQAKIAEQEAKAAERKEAAQRKAEEQAEKALQKENARIQKEIENQAKLETKEAERQAKIQAEAAEEERLAQIRENAVVGNQRIVEVVEERKQLLQEIADMEAANIGAGYRQYDLAVQKLAALEHEIRDYNNGIEEVKEKYRKLGQIAKNILSSMVRTVSRSLSNAFRSFGNVAKKSLSSISSMLKRATSSMLSFGKSTKSTNNILGVGFKNILKYVLGIRSLFALINKLRSAIKEGFTNLYNGSESFKNTIDELRASALTLQNSFAAAFRPLVEVAVPYIKTLLDYMTQAVNAASQLMAALFGRQTYTKAIKQTTAALKEETKESNKQLSSLDKLNNLTSKKDSGADGGAAGMFEEEVPISDKWKNIAQWLKDMWENSDFYELGKLLGEKLKEALDNIPWDKIKETARKIGKSIATFINGFVEVEGLGYSIGKTLAEAINTGFEFLNAFVHNLHWDSIGKFIAETINGFFTNIDWNLIYDTFVTGAKGLGDAINSFVDNLDWEAISSNIANFVNTFAATVLTFFTTVDWEEFGKRIGETLTETIKKIDFEKVGRAIGSVIQAAIDFVKNIISELSFEDVVSAITDLLKGFFEEANWTDIAKIALSLLASALVMQSSILKLSAVALAILSAFQDELLALDWKKAGETVGEAFKEFFSFIATTIENIDWWAIGESVKDFLVGIDWNGVFDALCEAIGAAFGAFAAFLGGLIAEGVVSAGEYFQDKIEEAGGNVVEGILVGIAEALVNIGAWIKEHVFEPFMEGFRKAFQIHSPSKAMESIGRYIIDGLLNGLKDSWKNIVSWITDKINWLKEKLSGMAGSFKSAFSGGGFGSRSAGTGGASRMSAASPYSTNPAFAALAAAPIPKLATGAVIPPNKEFLAVLGDQKSGTNIEAPLEMIEQANKKSLLGVLEQLGITGGGNSNQTINLNLTVECEGYQLLRIMQKLDGEYFKQHGRHAFV